MPKSALVRQQYWRRLGNTNIKAPDYIQKADKAVRVGWVEAVEASRHQSDQERAKAPAEELRYSEGYIAGILSMITRAIAVDPEMIEEDFLVASALG